MSGTLLLVISVVVLSSITVSAKECSTNSDCEKSCCLLGPSRYAVPTCMPFQQKGEQCRVNADTITTKLTYPDDSEKTVNDVHYILCPCADGLSCDPKRGVCN
ncbi:hypothetical protein PUN28_014943 [Cardiocondyla obscurior]